MQRVLVTGGAGFIGSHLVRALLARGVQVRVLDNLSSGRAENLRGLDLDFVEADIRDGLACRSACEGVDTVFHLAALVSVPASVDDPAGSETINSAATLNLLLAARDCGVGRFVLSSSAAVYGDTAVIPTSEETLPVPLSPYGIQKLTAEHYARCFTRLYGLATVSLRYFNVYGPGQSLDSAYAAAIPKFLSRLARGEMPTVFGDGEQTRDFCFVTDVAQANIRAATTENPAAFGNVFNIASGARVSVNDLIAQMGQVIGRPLAPVYAPSRAGDILHSGADISRAQTVLGFAPAVDLAAGIRETAAFYGALI